MQFIHSKDYEAVITAEHLLQLVPADKADALDQAERFAEGLLKLYLKGRYEIEAHLKIVEDYNPGRAYDLGKFVREAGVIYEAIVAAPAGTPVTNATYYRKNDPRDPLIVWLAVTLSLCNAHKRVAPKAMPEHRKEACKEAMEILTKMNEGELVPEVPPVVEEEQSGVVAVSSNPRHDWNY